MFWVYLNDRSAISTQEGNSLQLDVIFAILMVSGTSQMVLGLTTDMRVTMLRFYNDIGTWQVRQHAPGNKVVTNITII